MDAKASDANQLNRSSKQRPVRLLFSALAVLAAAEARGQDAVAGRGLSVGASLEAMVTSTVDRREGGQSTSDLVGELRPSLQISSRSGKVVGSLLYSLQLQYRQNDYQGENIHNQLSASFSAELVDRWMYLDVGSSVTQQYASTNGQLSDAGSTRDNANRIEVGTLSIVPSVRGVLGGAVNYDLRITASGTNGRRSIAADSTSTGGSASFSSSIPGSLLGWGLSLSRQTVDFRAGRETTSDRYSLSLSYIPDPDVTLTARGGQEKTDVAAFARTSYNNWGGGITWRPSPRLRAHLEADERYFGRSYQALLDYRMPRSSIQFSSSRDAGNGANPGLNSQPVTLYQLLDQILTNQYPDPVVRDQQIRLMLGGADPNQLVSGGAVASAIVVQQRHQLVATYSGKRVSASAQVFASRTRSANSNTGAAQRSEQWGYLMTAQYQLSPTSSVSMNGSKTIVPRSDSAPSSNLKSLSLSWSDQLARRTSASVALRYSVFNSSTDPYREASLTASLNQRF